MVARRVTSGETYAQGLQRAVARKAREQVAAELSGNAKAGSTGHSTAPVDPARFLGTRDWQARKRHLADKRGKDYSQEREIKHIYRHLEMWHDLVDRVNASAETETGKELSPAMVNYLDLEFAIRAIPSFQQRECWNLAIVGRQRVFSAARGQWAYVSVPRMSYSQIGGALGLTEKAVRNTISLATAFLLTFLYEPEG